VKEDAAELALAALLDALASVLIPLEITPGRLSQIARASFVKIGITQARMRVSGRPHLARIAALTGLSRAEVKRLVSTNFKVGKRQPDTSPRALRVLNAWQKSKRYSRAGRTRPLRIQGPFPSFETLCREYSGDIPYRVILTELERRENLTFQKNRSWVSINRSPKHRAAQRDELKSLVFAASIIESLSHENAVLVRRKATVKAPNNIQDSYVEKAVAGRVEGLLESLPQLFVTRRNSRRNKARVDVFTLVSKNNSIRSSRS